MTKKVFRIQRSFTLIELLVVVAIIAVLIAILLPALATAREQAKQAVCKGNMKQIFMGYEFFAMERNGFIPNVAGHYGRYAPDGYTNLNPHWPNRHIFYQGTSAFWCITNYGRLWYRHHVADVNVFYCPSDGNHTKANSWDSVVQGSSPETITFFNNANYYGTAGYSTRFAPNAVYVGGGATVEEQESRWDKLPESRLDEPVLKRWFLLCNNHYDALAGKWVSFLGFADTHVETNISSREFLGW